MKTYSILEVEVTVSYSNYTEPRQHTNICTSSSQLGDTGFYTCVASSPSGEASWRAYLQVEGRLHILR